MARESTLDEFARDGDDGSEGDDRRDGADAPTADAGDATPDPSPRADRAAAAITCEWTPAGAACEACGATVERRWRDGDAWICADCKEW